MTAPGPTVEAPAPGWFWWPARWAAPETSTGSGPPRVSTRRTGWRGTARGTCSVADAGNGTIRKVAIATATVTTLAGASGQTGSADGTGTAARFSQPAGLAYDGAGNLYVADPGSNTIRRVAVATGAVATVAGTAGVSGTKDGVGAAARFNGPYGLALDGAGDLFVADEENDTVRKIVLGKRHRQHLRRDRTAGTSGYVNGIGTAAVLFEPVGITFDGAGTLFVIERGTGTLRTIVLATAEVSSVPDTGGAFEFPLGAVADGRERLRRGRCRLRHLGGGGGDGRDHHRGGNSGVVRHRRRDRPRRRVGASPRRWRLARAASCSSPTGTSVRTFDPGFGGGGHARRPGVRHRQHRRHRRGRAVRCPGGGHNRWSRERVHRRPRQKHDPAGGAGDRRRHHARGHARSVRPRRRDWPRRLLLLPARALTSARRREPLRHRYQQRQPAPQGRHRPAAR